MDLRVLGLEWHMTVRATREWRAPDRPLPWLWIWLAAWGGLVWIALRRVKVAVV